MASVAGMAHPFSTARMTGMIDCAMGLLFCSWLRLLGATTRSAHPRLPLVIKIALGGAFRRNVLRSRTGIASAAFFNLSLKFFGSYRP